LDEDEGVTAVSIGHLRVFDSSGVDILLRICETEITCLNDHNKDGANNGDIKAVCIVLETSPSIPSKPLVSYQGKCVHLSPFSP